MDRLRALLARFIFDERVVLVPLLVLIIGVWFFVELADEVLEGSTQRFDDWAVRAMRTPENPSNPIGPAWLEELARDFTAMGGVAVLLLTIAIVTGFLFLQRKRRSAWFVLAASLGGLLASLALKQLYQRERPQIVPHLSTVYTHSFPSGHSMLSAAIYLTLGALLARTVQDRATRLYCVSVACLITVLVGISRVYLGVHYPTDVLAGWAAGGSWAVLCWVIAAYLQKRGAVERPTFTLGEHSSN